MPLRKSQGNRSWERWPARLSHTNRMRRGGSPSSFSCGQSQVRHRAPSGRSDSAGLPASDSRRVPRHVARRARHQGPPPRAGPRGRVGILLGGAVAQVSGSRLALWVAGGGSLVVAAAVSILLRPGAGIIRSIPPAGSSPVGNFCAQPFYDAAAVLPFPTHGCGPGPRVLSAGTKERGRE